MAVSDKAPAASRKRPTFLFAAVLAALVLIFFRAVVFTGDVFFFRDFGLFFYPKRLLAAAAVRNGTLPLWESLSTGGIPILSTYQEAVLYPLSLIYYVLPMPRSLMLFVVAHFLITGFGAALLLRSFGTRRLAAAAGALLWTFAPAFVSVVDNVSFLTSLAWLPWCLFFARRIYAAPSFARFLGLCISMAMALLAGAPEPVMFICLALAALALAESYAAFRRRRAPQSVRRSLVVAAAVLVAVLLSGVELAPFFYHLTQSERSASLAPSAASSWSMAPRDFTLCILPRFYLYAERGDIYWADQRWLKSVYLGAAVPLLALWTVLFMRRRRNLSFTLVLVFFTLLALGGYSPLWRLAYRVVPFFALIRYPVKFFLPAAFAASMLAGFAVDDILSLSLLRARRARAVAAALFVLGLLLLAGAVFLVAASDYARVHVLPPRVAFSGSQGVFQAAQQFDASRWSLARSGAIVASFACLVFLLTILRGRLRLFAAVAALVILVGDVFVFSHHLNPVTDSAAYTRPPYHRESVDTGPGAGRYLMTSDLQGFLKTVRLARFGSVNGIASFLTAARGRLVGEEDILQWAREASGIRFDDISALDRYLTGSPAVRIVETAQNEFYKESFYPNTHLLFGVPVANQGSVMRVKWNALLYNTLLDRDDAETLISRLYSVSTRGRWVGGDAFFTFERLADPVPRAFLTDRIVPAADDAAALALVTAGDFDPRSACVLLDADASDAAALLAGGGGLSASVPSLAWVDDSGNRQVLSVTSPRPTLLYVADSFYPAFRARVSGAPAPIYRANYAFRAVPVPAGSHTVEFVYYPLELYVGMIATAAGCLVLLLIWMFLKRRAEFLPS